MSIKKLTLVVISFLFLFEVLPVMSASRGRLRFTEISPSPITLNGNNSEATLMFSVEGMIISTNILAMIMTAGGVPVEVELIPNNPNINLADFGLTLEPTSGLITFNRPSREFGTFETKLKFNSQNSQRTIRNLVTQGAFSCERQNGTLQNENNIGNVGQNIVILCMGQGLTGETMIELGGSTGDTSIAMVTPGAMFVDVNPDGSVTNIDFIVYASMTGQTDVAFDFIGSMTFEVLPTFWNFQGGNGGNNMQGSSTSSSSSGSTVTSMIPFQILVDDTLRPQGAIMSFSKLCSFSPPTQDTGAFVTCP